MNANAKLGDQFIRHAIDLERFTVGQQKRALAILKSLEEDLVVRLKQASLTANKEARLRALLSQVRATIATAYKRVRERQDTDLYELAKVEAKFVSKAVNGIFGVEVITVGIGAQHLKSIVSDLVIEGGPQAKWWARQSAKTEQAFASTIKKGLVEGKTTPELVSDVKVLFQGMVRRNVAALVRTSVASVSNNTRLELYEENDDIIQYVQQRSVLDGRTTDICKAYSGKIWTLPDYEPVGHDLPFNAGVPRHWGCRSTIIPVLPDFAFIGAASSKVRDISRARKYFERRLKEQGLGDKQIAVAMRNAQASMDGQVPEDWDYEAWLSSKSESFQREVLGPSKYDLWKRKKLSFSDLVDERGNPLTVEELKKRVA